MTLGSIESISLSNSEYFDVFGGFQPPIRQIPLYSLTEEEFNKVPEKERQILFQAILDAREIDRYTICHGKRYWIVANKIDVKKLKKEFTCIYTILKERIQSENRKFYEFPNVRNIKNLKNIRKSYWFQEVKNIMHLLMIIKSMFLRELIQLFV